MEDVRMKELGCLYFQHMHYPVFFILRDKIIAGNNSFKTNFGENNLNKNVFSIIELYDESENKVTTLLDIAYNKIYLFKIINPVGNNVEGKIFFDIISSGEYNHLFATVIFSISNNVDLAFELTHERHCRIENEDELRQYIEELEVIDDALNESNIRFQEMTNLLPQTIYETDLYGNIIFFNTAGEKLFGFSKDEIDNGIKPERIFANYELEKAKNNLQRIFDGEDSQGNEYLMMKKDGTKIPMKAYASRILKDGKPSGVRGVLIDITDQKLAEQQTQENLELIKYQKQQIEEQYEFVTKQNMEIVESMNYARRIQNALLPSDQAIKELINEYFILFKPKEIVSGDFYWVNSKDEKIMMAAADCTGHGIPGAFMSMLAIAFLNDIANSIIDPTPANILNQLRAHVIHALKQDSAHITSMDGLDIALCVIDTNKNEIQFSGANNPLYAMHNNTLIEYPSDKMPIGYALKYNEFTNKTIKLNRGDTFYIFSDGYMDQFGGAKNKKFKPHRFQQLIKIHKKPMHEQKEILYLTLEEWKGEKEQVDDIIIIGFRY